MQRIVIGEWAGGAGSVAMAIREPCLGGFKGNCRRKAGAKILPGESQHFILMVLQPDLR
jgi:hypothetical protein